MEVSDKVKVGDRPKVTEIEDNGTMIQPEETVASGRMGRKAPFNWGVPDV